MRSILVAILIFIGVDSAAAVVQIKPGDKLITQNGELVTVQIQGLPYCEIEKDFAYALEKTVYQLNIGDKEWGIYQNYDSAIKSVRRLRQDGLCQ